MRDGWLPTTLGELAKTARPSPASPESRERYVGLEHFDSGHPRIARWGSIDTVSSSTTAFVAGDVLFGKLRPYLRKVAIADFEGRCTNEVLVYRPSTDSIVGGYLGLILQSPETIAFADASSAGSRMPRTSVKLMSALPVVLPPLNEQRRIVDLIGSLDDVIEVAQRSADLGCMLYEVLLRDMSKGVSTTTIGSVVSTARSGGTPSRKRPEHFGGGIPWVKSGEVNSDSIGGSEETISDEGLASSSAWIVPVGSTLVAMYGQGDTKGTAGFVTSPVSTNQAVLALVPDESKVLSSYLLHAVRSRTDSLRKQAVGAAQPNLSKAIITAESIPVPSLERQSKTSDALGALLSSISGARTLAYRLRELRSNLLTVLLSGEHQILESYDALTKEVAS